MTDDKQLERFKQAVEEKNEDAQRKAQASPPNPSEPALPEEEPELHDPGRPQDTRDERAKSSRHGQVTADKWNQ
jgi:hypothetical protein